MRIKLCKEILKRFINLSKKLDYSNHGAVDFGEKTTGDLYFISGDSVNNKILWCKIYKL